MLQKPGPESPQVMATQPSQPAGTPGNNGGTQVQLTLQSGKVITLPNYPTQPFAKTVETLGANGATSLLSDNLESIAEQMLAAGEIDEAQYNSLMTLANKGHKIAGMESRLEAIINGSTTYKGLLAGLKADPELFNSKNTSILLGFDNPGGGVVTGSLDSMDDLKAKGFTNDFLLAYQEAARNGSLDDPVIKQVVDQLAADISSLSDSLEHQTNKVLHQYGGYYDPNQVLDRVVSDMTHQDSKGICTAGKGQDTGIQCTG